MAGYDKVFLLGRGSYGKVWLVEETSTHCSRRRQQSLVLKEINLKGLGDKDIQQSLTEVTILSKCIHPHIIGYTEAFVNRRASKLCIVMEFASGGDLHKQITQRKGLYFPDETVLCWFSQLVSALSYIHNRGILHRDIKPQNLFLDGRHVLKLGDFGISRILHGDADVAITFVGTPFYLSPEICNQQPYSFKSDMWSAGCVLYELCCLRVPFIAVNLPSLITQIQSGHYSPLPSHCGDLLCDLVGSLLTADPEVRLSADDILLLPTLQKHLQETSITPSQLQEEELMVPSVRGRQLTKCKHGMRTKRSLDRSSVETVESKSRGELAVLGEEVLYKHKTPPRQSLFQAVQQMKAGSDDSDSAEDNIIEDNSCASDSKNSLGTRLQQYYCQIQWCHKLLEVSWRMWQKLCTRLSSRNPWNKVLLQRSVSFTGH